MKSQVICHVTLILCYAVFLLTERHSPENHPLIISPPYNVHVCTQSFQSVTIRILIICHYGLPNKKLNLEVDLEEFHLKAYLTIQHCNIPVFKLVKLLNIINWSADFE